VQRITRRGQTVRADRADRLVDRSWPKFLYPYPLDGKYFLVSAKPTKDASWGVYLVDVFDNMVLLAQEPGKVLFEPVPARARKRPPVIPDRVDPGNPEATVYIADIYRGPGLAGVPRGTVKELQLYTFDFPISGGFHSQSGQDVGLAGPWDLHAVLGRVPVEPDGSASFTVPANTPISIQPLDAEGKAVQLMRTWLTAMPGEKLSCVGCHETPGTAPPARRPAAFGRDPSRIEPWLNSPRPFDFRRDIQPILNRKCLGCHDQADRAGRPDLRDLPMTPVDGFKSRRLMKFEDWSRAYYYLQRYVHRAGPESEVPTLMPMEHHADTSELVQMLRKGHHGVRLTDDQWDRLIVWIDLNVPFHGSWKETPGSHGRQVVGLMKNRRELMRRYAGRAWVVEPVAPLGEAATAFEAPEPGPPGDEAPELAGWPMDVDAARELQQQGPDPIRRRISFGQAGKLDMVWIPPGSFVLGSVDATPDERPLRVVQIDRGFWMSTTEISNGDFRQFDPEHHSRTFAENGMGLVSTRDYRSLNGRTQPVVRVSWQGAMKFCRWLREQTGESFDLPTEAQWEWACRAGGDAEFPQASGDRQKEVANCAGVAFGNFYDRRILSHRLFDPSWNDGQIETERVGANEPNAWGLKNMHGNAAEWTRSLYRPYPYKDDDGRNDPQAPGKRVVRGGSFSDRPKRCTASYRLGYKPWQGVYNVGFRVIIRPETETAGGAKP
jgi:formylglycine-generating enzyme required for sulfatase activity